MNAVEKSADAMGRRFPLALQPAGSMIHKPVAWLIRGSDPAAWLGEMAAWGIPLVKARLLIIPRSLTDLEPCGVLFLPGDGPAPDPRCASPAVLGYGLVGSRLYLPADARLYPDVCAAELQRLLIHDIQVFPPSAGMIGYSHSEVVRPANLIQPPHRREENWGLAKAGPQTAAHLLSVESDSPPTLATILEAGRDDIGSLEDQTHASLAKPGSDFADKITEPFMRLKDWISGRLGVGEKGGAGPGGDRLDAARQAELNRLLEMLRNDPDQGLQYAIPMGPAATRGMAPRTGKLASHQTDFSLGRLRGATPADRWNVPWQMRQKLLEQYRAAGNRELALGRHRRAAYIFAELLGDFTAAAHALRAGGHHREAAALFRDPLRNLRAAAESLEEGGLLIEAVAVYEELKNWVRAGEVYEKLHRAEDAQRCFRAAVEEHIGRGEALSAAGLLEKKLLAPEEALQLLLAAWPAQDFSGLCLAESFELMGRMGQHEQAAARVRTVMQQEIGPRFTLPLAQALSGVSRLYPRAAVRLLAADATRVVVGNQLGLGRSLVGEQAALLQTVTRMNPEDRLLLRDANRFMRKTPPRSKPYPLAAVKVLRPAVLLPKVFFSFQLPAKDWRIAESRGGFIYAIGRNSGGNQQLARATFDGKMQTVVIRESELLLMNLTPRRMIPQIILRTELGKVLENNLTLPLNRTFSSAAIVGCPQWLPSSDVRGLCFGEDDIAWMLHSPDGSAERILRGFSLSSGSIVRNQHLTVGADSLSQTPMVARKGQIFCADAEGILWIPTTGPQAIRALPRPPVALIASPAFARVRIVATMSEGAAIFWPDSAHQEIVGDSLFDPVAGFLQNGMLVLMSADAGRAYRTSDGKTTHIASFPGCGKHPIALLIPQQEDTFAVVMVDGTVNVYSANFEK
ncbi:MAG: tetratricopeptide repeat protein [Planctomycetota bacterium]|nr:tetratricopeptide repeat protein [Planctomycetota bacterium]